MPSKESRTPRRNRQSVADQWEVVIVPFPFSTQPGNKRRPALVLSQRDFNKHGSTVLAMITTAAHRPWPGDVTLTNLHSAGLNVPCLVRIKLFTIDNRLIIKKIGRLATADEKRISAQLRTLLPW